MADLPILNLSDPTQKRMLLGYIRGLEGLHRISITRCKEQRTLQQNAYYWGVVLPCIADGLREVWGEDIGTDRTHEFLKLKFEATPLIDHRTGEIIGQTIDSTADYDVERFSRYLEKIIAFAADYLGVTVPPLAQYATDPVSPVPAHVGGSE